METRIATYHLSDGLLCMRIKDNAEISLADAIESVAVRKKIHGDQKVLFMVDMRKVGQSHRDAREYAASAEVEKINKAVALLVGKSLPAIIMANFFIKFNRPCAPTKLFRDEVKALEWLESYR